MLPKLSPIDAWQIGIAILGTIGALGALFSRRIQERLQRFFEQNPLTVFGIPLTWCLVYAIFACATGVPDKLLILKFGAYVFTPTLCMYLAGNALQRFRWLDFVALAALWIPFDLTNFLRKPTGMKVHILDYPILAILAALLGITLYSCIRRLDHMKLHWCGSYKDVGILLCTLAGLGLLIISLGWKTFLVPRPFWAATPDIGMLVGAIGGKIFQWPFWGMVGVTALTVALPEEVFFRGIIQNLLGKTFRNRLFALIITACIFGSAHLEDSTRNGVLSIVPQLADPLTWNWPYMGMATIAGIGYGLAYRYTSSLLFPIILHALVDVLWGTFFITKIAP